MAHHIAQLQEFFQTIGPQALSHVQCLRLGGHRSSPGGQLWHTAAHKIATLLATACPNITHLAVGGMLGETVACDFGVVCPNIQTFELISSYEYKHFMRPYSGIPHWTTILPTFSRLVCLYAEGRNQLTGHWKAIPSTVQELYCHIIPSDFGRKLPSLKLDTLRILSVCAVGSFWWDAETLAALLKKAPHLHTISSTRKVTPAVYIGCVTMEQLSLLETALPRMQAGMKVAQLKLGYTPFDRSYEARGDQLKIGQVLTALPCFPDCVDCRIFLEHLPALDSLLQLPRVFPGMRRVVLGGQIFVKDLALLPICRSLEVLDIYHTQCGDVLGLVQLLVKMPRLSRIYLPAIQNLTTAQLRAYISAAYTPGAVDMGDVPPMELGDWTVWHSRFPRQPSVWVRCPPLAEPGYTHVEFGTSADFKFEYIH